MNTTDQQPIAAFIDDNGLPFEFQEYNGGWTLAGPHYTADFLNIEGHVLRIPLGQLTFGVPLSMAHLIQNPAGLSAEEITEGGKFRAGIEGDSKLRAQYWNGEYWRWIVPQTVGLIKNNGTATYRLPAYHPLPKVEGETVICRVCWGDGIEEIQSGPYFRPCKACNQTGRVAKVESDPFIQEMHAKIDSMTDGELIKALTEAGADFSKPAAEETPTPRTDAIKPRGAFHEYQVEDYANLSRTLERELTAALKRAEEAEAQRFNVSEGYSKACESVVSLEAKNRVLREALNETRQWITDWGPSFADTPNWHLTKKKIKKALQPLPTVKEGEG